MFFSTNLSVLYTILFFLLIKCMISDQYKNATSLKPNILFLIIDDMRYLMDDDVNLFNIKKLAGKSIKFENAFVQQALCAPSRNSILTGRRPDSLHVYDFYSYWRDSVGNFKTFPELFKQHGYDTYSVGKVFHPGISSNFSDDYPYSWTERPYHPPSERYKNTPVCLDKHTKRMQKDLICPVVVKKQPGETLPDLETLKYAIDILNSRSGDKPFLLAVGFHKPHVPLKYPKQYRDKVPIDSIQPPRFPYMPDKLPTVAWHPWTDVRSRDDIKSLNISFPFGTMPPKWTLKIKQSYYAASLYIDNLIGKLLSHVDNNTIVVLTSDHGWSLGENGLWAKYSNFEVALKVPLIFSVPDMTPNSVLSPVELIDIFPTLVELAGLNIDIPKCQNVNDKSDLCYGGKSLVPLMSEKHGNGTEYYAISQYPRPSVYPQSNSDKPRLNDIKIMGYSIRTDRYRYTEWIHFNSTSFKMNWDLFYGGELYDHYTDSNESNNLYTDHNNEQLKYFLSKLLRTNVDPDIMYMK